MKKSDCSNQSSDEMILNDLHQLAWINKQSYPPNLTWPFCALCNKNLTCCWPSLFPSFLLSANVSVEMDYSQRSFCIYCNSYQQGCMWSSASYSNRGCWKIFEGLWLTRASRSDFTCTDFSFSFISLASFSSACCNSVTSSNTATTEWSNSRNALTKKVCSGLLCTYLILPIVIESPVWMICWKASATWRSREILERRNSIFGCSTVAVSKNHPVHCAATALVGSYQRTAFFCW